MGERGEAGESGRRGSEDGGVHSESTFLCDGVEGQEIGGVGGISPVKSARAWTVVMSSLTADLAVAVDRSQSSPAMTSMPSFLDSSLSLASRVGSEAGFGLGGADGQASSTASSGFVASIVGSEYHSEP